MRLFPPEPVIGSNDGFNEHDIFGYATFGEQLKDFYGKFDDPLVGVLDAPWGSGKSTFIKMWCGYMRNEGHPVIEFDAFKNDYTDDAFMALAGEVLLLAEELNGDAEEVRKEFVEKATNVIVAAGKGGLKAFARKAFTAEGADEIGNALAGAVQGATDGLEAIITEKLQSRKKEKAAFESFAEALSSLSEQLGKSDVEGNKAKPLIFVIDELDRCKPTFALALLEKIKHFFSVPNVHFLLVTNLEQLSKVVMCEYGTEIDSEVYLQKFYDVALAMPKGEEAPFKQQVDIFCKHMITQCNTHINIKPFSELMKEKKLSLRAILKVHAYAVAKLGKYDVIVGFRFLYIGLACMRVADRNIFNRAINGTLSKKDVDLFFEGNSSYQQRYREAFYMIIGSYPEADEARNRMAEMFDHTEYSEGISKHAKIIEQLDLAS